MCDDVPERGYVRFKDDLAFHSTGKQSIALIT